MSMFRKGLIFAASIITITALPLTQIPVMAMEGGTEAFGSVMLPTINEEIISVDLPTVGDESPFDFYIDPQGLLYETDGIKYGGGVVEEGAYLLFRNHNEGKYDFSRYSDRLSVTNRSTVPINVKITAKISDIGELRMDQDGVFDCEDDPAIYLAIVDDEGNERVLSEDGEVSAEIEMNRAPSEAYTYHYDESTDSYEYIYQNNEDISFDTYSFGLRGECNANADWSGVSASPIVIVTWSVDPIYPESEGTSEVEVEEQEEEFEDELSEIENGTQENENSDATEEVTEKTDGVNDTGDNQPGANDAKSENATETKPEGDSTVKPSQDEQTQVDPDVVKDPENSESTGTNASDTEQNMTGKDTEKKDSEGQEQTTGSSDTTGTAGDTHDTGGVDA